MIRLVINNGPDELKAAWEAYDGMAIEMAAMWANPHRCSSTARLEHAKDLIAAEARFRSLFQADCNAAVLDSGGEEPRPAA